MSRIASLNMCMSVITRLRSAHNTPLNTPPQIVALSILAYKNGVPRKYWRLMSACKVLMSYTWTEKFVQELSAMELHTPYETATTLALSCFDNCGYYRRVGFERVTASSDYLDTVNWYTIPIPSRFELPQDLISRWKEGPRPNISLLFSPDASDHSVLLDFCSFMTHQRLISGESLLSYPIADNIAPTYFVIRFPIIDLSTASYDDIRLMLWLIHDEVMRENPTTKFVIIVGDEQTYDRMVKLMSQAPNEFSWLIPFPGEFHFTAHCLHASYRLWWCPILHRCRDFLDYDRVTPEWTMTKFNYQDDFMHVVVSGIVKWFTEIFGEFCFQNPTALTQVVSNNFTTALLWQFLYEDGLPYISLRTLLRMDPTRERRAMIDAFFVYYCMRMRSTNKVLYSMLCVHFTFFRHYLRDEIWRVLEEMYNASITGVGGRRQRAGR